MTELADRAAATLARITEKVKQDPPAEKLVPQLRAEIARLKAEIEALKQHAPDAQADAVREESPFQKRVGKWIEECFPPKVVRDLLERRDRLVEEALELAQTLPAFSADRAHALVDYVFSRPVGLTEQEVGGVSVTLAALCHAEGIDGQYWAEHELTRITAPEVMEKIRAKQAAKPVGSALPIKVRAQLKEPTHD